VFRFLDIFLFASRVVFAEQPDSGLKIFYALVAVGSALAKSGCGLRSCAARRIVIGCPS
jgi:hypothetical protein